MDIKDEISTLRRSLSASANDTNAKAMSAYMKGHFHYHGIKSPERKLLSAPFMKRWTPEFAKHPEELVKALWAQKEREYQYIAMEFLARAKRDWKADRLDLYHHLLVSKSWWDTVDMISSTLVGGLIKKYPELEEVMDEWNLSENMWLVRSSILYQLKYGQDMDLERLSMNILRHSESKEFFIQKAMGWILRQAARYHTDWVLHFVEVNRLPALTKREALKHFR
jgi:3-methyladenine DNA glycosylase AlkD